MIASLKVFGAFLAFSSTSISLDLLALSNSFILPQRDSLEGTGLFFSHFPLQYL